MKNNLAKVLTILLSVFAVTCFANACTQKEDEKTHVHEYPVEYSYDNEYHWFECDCGEKKDKAEHVLVDNKCECGYENSTETHTCVFDRKTIDDEYLKSSANCTESAVYYYSCKCGEKGNETFENGSPLVHKFEKYISNGDGTKTAQCENGCGEKHTIDEDHVHNYKEEVIAPTCEDKGYTKYTCECSHSYTGNEVPAIGHEYGAFVSDNDGIHHTKICKNDIEHKITEECTGGTATCKDKAICDVCKVVYGELKPHDHSIYLGKQYLVQTNGATDDVCSVDAYSCSKCGDVLARYNPHDYTESMDIASTCVERGFVGKICKNSECRYLCGEIKELSDHSYMMITAVEDPMTNKCYTKWYSGGCICSVCDKVELEECAPVGHENFVYEIKVLKYVGKDTRGILGGFCTMCNEADVTVLELPSLQDGAEMYTKRLVDSFREGDVVDYIYTYNGVEYTVASSVLVEHLTVIEDYTAEKYPMIKFMAGNVPSCEYFVDGAYICDICHLAVDAKVKAAHILEVGEEKCSICNTSVDVQCVSALKSNDQTGNKIIQTNNENIEHTVFTIGECVAHDYVTNYDGMEKVFYYFDEDRFSGQIKRVAFGYYCTTCKHYVILGWITDEEIIRDLIYG